MWKRLDVRLPLSLKHGELVTKNCVLSRGRNAGASHATKGPEDQKVHEIMFPRSAVDGQEVNSWKADEVFGEHGARMPGTMSLCWSFVHRIGIWRASRAVFREGLCRHSTDLLHGSRKGTDPPFAKTVAIGSTICSSKAGTWVQSCVRRVVRSVASLRT